MVSRGVCMAPTGGCEHGGCRGRRIQPARFRCPSPVLPSTSPRIPISRKKRGKHTQDVTGQFPSMWRQRSSTSVLWRPGAGCAGLRNHLCWWWVNQQLRSPAWYSLKGHLRTSDQKEHLGAAGSSKQKHDGQLNRGRLLGKGRLHNLSIPIPYSSFVDMQRNLEHRLGYFCVDDLSGKKCFLFESKAPERAVSKSHTG